MVTIIKKGTKENIISQLLKKVFLYQSKKGVDVNKFCGVLKIDKNALIIQHELRNEWK